MTIINCDMGEGFGIYRLGDDEALMPLMPLITAANVACGFHASDFNHMRRTVRLACEYRVKVGHIPRCRTSRAKDAFCTRDWTALRKSRLIVNVRVARISHCEAQAPSRVAYPKSRPWALPLRGRARAAAHRGH